MDFQPGSVKCVRVIPGLRLVGLLASREQSYHQDQEQRRRKQREDHSEIVEADDLIVSNANAHETSSLAQA